MNILFIARHFTYFRNFESVLVALAERGHHLCVAADREEQLGGRELVDRVAARFPGLIDVVFTSVPQDDRYRRLAAALRLGLDYLRYSDQRYEATPKIRERAYERVPAFAVTLARLPFSRVAAHALDWIEQAVPRPAAIDEFIVGHRPDVLLITPLIELGSPQLDYLRAARSHGIRSALCVWSWDHLSSKALIRVVPDVVIVWNETQRAEAERFHGIAPERVVVTGAQCFDQWFNRQPSSVREAFARRVGLPPDRPFLLYVCSALFKNSPSEAAFVRKWIDTIRRSTDVRLREVAILIRPHPQRPDEWRSPDALAGFEHVAVWGSNPVDSGARSDYFDSMYHASAVVGLNTSALVEAAIVDRPVFTVLLPEFRDNQEGTFHYQHLLNVGNGFLNAARSLDEHRAQLSALLSGGVTQPNRPFVEQFVRPHGADAAATPVFVDALEELAHEPPPPKSAVASLRLLALRPVVYTLALAGRLPWFERLYWHPHKHQDWQQNVRATRTRNARRRSKRQDKVRRLVRKAPHQAVVRVKTMTKQALGAAGLIRHS